MENRVKRTDTRQIIVGGVAVGGGAPVTVQSMCSTDTRDVEATLSQIRRLAEGGCDIVRAAVPDREAAEALRDICRRSPLPVVADIHFNYHLAVAAAEAGAAKIRINPGNIGSAEAVHAVVRSCAGRKIPIRIGVNSGSLEGDLLKKYGRPCAEAMVESAERHVTLLTDLGFEDICLSLKASDVPTTAAAYRLASKVFPYPLHLGVTEAGTVYAGTVASAVGIGTLLCEGIGDTIRVSLTADPLEEVRAGLEILKASGLRKSGVRLISCPTCGRTKIDLISLAGEVEKRLSEVKGDMTVAVMGCVVNGPGEAKEADYGIAGGNGEGVLFRHGEIVEKVPEENLADALLCLIQNDLNAK